MSEAKDLSTYALWKYERKILRFVQNDSGHAARNDNGYVARNDRVYRFIK